MQVDPMPTTPSTRIAFLLFMFACGGEVASPSFDGGTLDQTAGDARLEAGADTAPGPPMHLPTFIAFDDQDPRQGYVDGNVLIGRALDESDITNYDLYWATSAGIKVAPIAGISKLQADLSYTLTTAVPNGANVLALSSSNDVGDMSANLHTDPADKYAVYTDISAGQGMNSAGIYGRPSASIDTTNQKLLVVTENGANASKPALFRCNLDGSACGYTDISVGQGMNSGRYPSLVIDAANQKLLAVTSTGLFRCNLDGGNCAFADIYGGYGVGGWSSSVFDAANKRLLVAREAGPPAIQLFVCSPDGFACTYIDVTQGKMAGGPSVVIDVTNQKLLIVCGVSGMPGLFRCNLDGTNCGFTDISGGQGAEYPMAMIDVVDQRLLVVSSTPSKHVPILFACDLNGANCTHTDISTGVPPNWGHWPWAVLDTVKQKLLTVATAGSANPGLFRCKLNGASCAYGDMSAGQPYGSGWNMTAVIDETNRKLLVVTEDGAKSDTLGLFSLPL